MPSLGNQTAVLVGTGPSATSWRAGALIDSFDLVVRFNHFRTDGYEPWVGTKTDIWVINGPRYRLEDGAPQVRLLYSVPLPLIDDDLRYLAALRRLGARVSVLDETVLDHVKTEFRRSCLTTRRGLPYPSTGVIAAHLLLADVSVLYLHGFDFMQSGVHHYYEPRRRQELVGWHDPGAEASFFAKLVDQGRVRALRPSTRPS